MARKKTASDEIYNQRRRARRELARIEKQLDSGSLSAGEMRRMTDYAARLRTSIENSYIQKNVVRGMNRKERKALSANAKQALRSAGATLESIARGRNATDRENMQFAEKMRRAKHGEPSGMSGMDKYSVQMFYVATKRLWQGVHLNQRNETIMKALGTNSLEEAYRVVMHANRERLMNYREMLAGLKPDMTVEGWTNEAKFFYEDTREIWEGTRLTSPTDVVFF